jgi:hypothetical protein
MSLGILNERPGQAPAEGSLPGHLEAKEAPMAKKQTVGRDSRNGQFIPMSEVKRRPSTTEKQTIKRGK